MQDTGAGLLVESADKLFDAFYTTKGDGMGIGLSVSRMIIERHEGRLWAAPNDRPGATFSFSLPRANERSWDVAHSAHSGMTGVTEGSLVSVVDDDDAVREALSDVLREFGFVVEVFASARAVLASAAMERTEFLVLESETKVHISRVLSFKLVVLPN